MKGSEFERQVCKDLSIWWTGDIDKDDVFWRSSNSGGRATARARKGKKTYGHEGDIAATDPIGEPLLKFFTIEVKRGYTEHNFAALLDRPRQAAQQMWESWIQQATEAHERSGSFSWLIIARRDQRERIVMFPDAVISRLDSEGLVDDLPRPSLRLSARIRFKYQEKGTGVSYKSRKCSVVAMRWDEWIDWLKPNAVRAVLKGLQT